MKKKVSPKLSAHHRKMVSEQLRRNAMVFDTSSGQVFVTDEFDYAGLIPAMVEQANTLMSEHKDSFSTKILKFQRFYGVIPTGGMAEICRVRRAYGRYIYNPLPHHELNPQADSLLRAMHAICPGELASLTTLEGGHATETCKRLNDHVDVYRNFANSAAERKKVRVFYRSIAKNYDSTRDYLLELANQYRSLTCVWLDFVFQRGDTNAYLNSNIDAGRIEEARRSVIRFMKKNAPMKSHAGFVWQISISKFKGVKLTVLSLLDNRNEPDFREYTLKVMDYWRDVITQGQGFCAQTPLPSGAIPARIIFKDRSCRANIENIAVSFTKTHFYVRPKIDKGKTVGHGIISKSSKL